MTNWPLSFDTASRNAVESSSSLFASMKGVRAGEGMQGDSFHGKARHIFLDVLPENMMSRTNLLLGVATMKLKSHQRKGR